jgi:hypothetical protein
MGGKNMEIKRSRPGKLMIDNSELREKPDCGKRTPENWND